MKDFFDLQRFLTAQDEVYAAVLAELRRGTKRTHWMWFIFPQMRGLGRSETAEHFGITSREEAEAYAGHPTLGVRLRECTNLVNAITGRSALDIFGGIDSLKFRSSMTLFAAVAGDQIFWNALNRFFQGEIDQRTLDLLHRPRPAP